MFPWVIPLWRATTSIAPHNLVPKVLLTEDCIHYEFEVVAGVGVTM